MWSSQRSIRTTTDWWKERRSQKWQNTGQFSAVLVRILGGDAENCFTLSRSVETGVQWVPCLEAKKEILAKSANQKRSEAA
jgi:hypothetical protein